MDHKINLQEGCFLFVCLLAWYFTFKAYFVQGSYHFANVKLVLICHMVWELCMTKKSSSDVIVLVTRYGLFPEHDMVFPYAIDTTKYQHWMSIKSHTGESTSSATPIWQIH